MRFLSRWAALALALALVFVLGGCGVAHFDDSGAWNLDENSSASSESDAYRQQREDLGAKLSGLVDDYNEGVEEFAAAIEDEVELPKDLSEDYDGVGEKLGEYQQTVAATINDMTGEELEEMDKNLDNVAKQVENLRAELEKAIVKDAQKADSSSGA